jgi:predicted GTPase
MKIDFINDKIIGRSNTGKSSLFNFFCCFQRVISPPAVYRPQRIQLINRPKNQNKTLQYHIVGTAGIRKEFKVAVIGTENLTVRR